MGCFSCFKCPEDRFEEETNRALEISRIEEADRIRRQRSDEEFERVKKESVMLAEQEETKRRLEELKQKEERKQVDDDDDQVEDKGQIIKHSKDHVNPPPPRTLLEEDMQLPKAVEENLKEKGKGKQSENGVEDDGKLPMVNPPRSMCGSCKFEIEHGNAVDVLGVPWHPECLWCDACQKLIAIHEVETIVSNSRGKFHKSCHERYCYVCKDKLKTKMYKHHHFWKERYCPAHESDGTHKCCSCERLEAKGANYVMLDDRRWLCLECMESAVMDTDEGQPLHFEIREFFETLHMKIEKEFPFLLVEKQALNQAEKEEKIDSRNEMVTRGICLSDSQTVISVSKKPRMGPNKQLIGMVTESLRVVRECGVTAILILYGLPRVLTGYILAHEMMHAYLRLNGHRIISNVLEEGICQVLGHMWLESQTYATVEAEASSSASVSHTPAAACASKKGKCSDFEKELVRFCKNQIETDDSPDYGVGFRKVNEMVTKSSLQETLKDIIRRR